MIRVINRAGAKVVQIMTDIGAGFFSEGVTLQSVQDQIKDFAGEITIEINSKGGDAVEGLAIHDYFASLPNEITALVIGQCSSAATVIACAAKTIKMTPNSRWLAHRVRASVDGNSDTLKSTAQMAGSMDGQIAAIYAKRTGKSVEEMLALMEKDEYITAQEALALGFINEIVELKSNNKMSNFKNLTDEEKEKMDELEKENKALKAELEDLKAKLKAKVDEDEEKEAKAAVEAAINEGKFIAEKRDELVSMAKGNLAAFKAMAASVQIKTGKTVINAQVPDAGLISKDTWLSNWKSGKYDNDAAQMRADYKQAFGEEPKF